LGHVRSVATRTARTCGPSWGGRLKKRVAGGGVSALATEGGDVTRNKTLRQSCAAKSLYVHLAPGHTAGHRCRARPSARFRAVRSAVRGHPPAARVTSMPRGPAARPAVLAHAPRGQAPGHTPSATNRGQAEPLCHLLDINSLPDWRQSTVRSDGSPARWRAARMSDLAATSGIARIPWSARAAVRTSGQLRNMASIAVNIQRTRALTFEMATVSV